MDPIFTEIATTLATKAAGGLWDLVKAKLSKRKDGAAALELAKDAPPESARVHVLAEEIQRDAAADPVFEQALRVHWQQANISQVTTNITNTFSGRADGPVIQVGQQFNK
ncbi:hypothetical protein D5S17_09930 [Pseudonocardiaceae bacterium YIM PH 21723]|nr:hypothetical protein D5S17_09930 [Pseudonocardiaceae bacterium YIM PH 21723]